MKNFTKALILAAGLGTRLAPITNSIPKSLVKVNGIPILMKQINNLYLNGISDITIISGYKGTILKSVVHHKYPNIKIIENREYAITNNMYSAYLGRVNMADSSFIMMNADVFFDASVITRLLDFKSDNAIVVDIGRYLDESMKIVEKNGRVVEISKSIEPNDSFGTSIDVYKFSTEGGKIFFNKCAYYIEKKNKKNLWSEVALNDTIKELIFRACPIDGKWTEIDTYDDLAKAQALFSKRQS